MSVLIKILIVLYWILQYVDTDSYYSVYVLLGIIAIASFFDVSDSDEKLLIREKVGCICLSSIILICTLLANYYIWNYDSIRIISVFASGFFTLYSITVYVYKKISNENWIIKKQNDNIIAPSRVFFFSIVVICLSYFVYYFLCAYPGHLTIDSISQINQCMSDVYTNHHPYWHTMIIKSSIYLGKSIFGSMNAGVVIYSIFQVVFMSVCFACAVVTLYQYGMSQKIVFVAIALYALLPYNIIYSVTMWKDIMFAGGVLLFLTGVFRVVKKIGSNQIINYILVIVGGICFGIFRNNGLYALIATTCMFVVIFKTKHIKLVCTLIVIIICSLQLKGPLLDKMHVQPTGLQESLSIPCQQIARVIVENGNITSEQMDSIDRIIDTEKIPDLYKEYISDPIKGAIDTDYLSKNFENYIKIWIEIGIQNPICYLKAWIEQTKGYWHGGYDYWIVARYIKENEWGICRTAKDNCISTLLEGYVDMFFRNHFFEPFRSIGLHVWGILAGFFFNMINGKKEKACLFLPLIFLVATLLIATPVYSEFRYAYAVFTCSPLLWLLTAIRDTEE